MPHTRTKIALIAALVACASAIAWADMPVRKLDKIQHIIVISLENHSFDNLFGHYPGADGISRARETAIQLDKDGKAYSELPVVFKSKKHHGPIPNGAFPFANNVAMDETLGELVHRFYQEQEQINGGQMNHFVSVSDGAGLTMGYYDGSKTHLWKYAEKYTLADHFFHAAFGGSFLNHIWLVCACTPVYEKAPPSLRAKLDASGRMVKDGVVTPDGYAVNTIFSRNIHPPKTKTSRLLPLQDMPTIGDRLSEADVSWAWYGGGWNDARAGKPSKLFQYHHQPFSYFRNYVIGTQAAELHLKDSQDFFEGLEAGVLPAVSFFKPIGELTMHPSYSNVGSGDEYIASILDKIEKSPIWHDTVVIVTFDENGGFWDHVPPPKGDRWGPGTRVPTLIISPFARQHYVDHTVYDTTSILKFIETRFGLEPLTERDAKANDLTGALILN